MARLVGNKVGEIIPLIKCVQVNLNKSMSGVNMLTKIIAEDGIDVAFIQEPNIRGGRVRGFTSKMDVFFKAGGGPKTAICLNSENTSGMFLENISNDRFTVVEICKGGHKFYGISAYLPCCENKREDFGECLSELGRILRSLGNRGPIVLAVDCNAKSGLWGSPHEDRRGRDFCEFLEGGDLIVLNAGSVPTFSGPGGRESFIDVTACSLELAAHVENWYVDTVNEISDHRIIRFDIGGVGDPVSESRRFCTKRANWEKFDRYITANKYRVAEIRDTNTRVYLNDVASETRGGQHGTKGSEKAEESMEQGTG